MLRGLEAELLRKRGGLCGRGWSARTMSQVHFPHSSQSSAFRRPPHDQSRVMTVRPRRHCCGEVRGANTFVTKALSSSTFFVRRHARRLLVPCRLELRRQRQLLGAIEGGHRSIELAGQVGDESALACAVPHPVVDRPASFSDRVSASAKLLSASARVNAAL